MSHNSKSSNNPSASNIRQLTAPLNSKLGEWHATAICGNDITSSCLYVSALALLWAGPLAPISLILVGGVLWLFRGIYAEVVGALPLNGGAYNALLNTTSKFRASVAACFTILSYLATAVISANEAVHYGAFAFSNISSIAISHAGIELIFATIGILGAFALLTILGIGESAKVALGIFALHMFSLSLLLIVGGGYLLSNGLDTLVSNLSAPLPKANDWPLVFGFFVAMLGISGFESSANFVEEQQEGVFPKTLRNMWVAVVFFNPMICLLALSIVPLGEVDTYKNTLLAELGGRAGGTWLSLFISIDAALVLCGAVLTSYVGITGLVHRMTLDRCLPQFLLKQNSRGSFYRIVICFFLLASLLLILAKDVHGLAGVYTLSFLSVMFLFAVGNALLKVYRSRLPRPTIVSWTTVFAAAFAVAFGIFGQIVISDIEDQHYVQVFLLYFIPTLLIVMIMLSRTTLLKIVIYFVRRLSAAFGPIAKPLRDNLEEKIDEINSQTMVFFTRGDNIANLNRAMLYVIENEHTNKIKVVTVIRDKSEIPENLERDLDFLDKAYPEVEIELVIHYGTFSPTELRNLSKAWGIPLNFMFIGSPGQRFPHALSELGGVRLII